MKTNNFESEKSLLCISENLNIWSLRFIDNSRKLIKQLVGHHQREKHHDGKSGLYQANARSQQHETSLPHGWLVSKHLDCHVLSSQAH